MVTAQGADMRQTGGDLFNAPVAFTDVANHHRNIANVRKVERCRVCPQYGVIPVD